MNQKQKNKEQADNNRRLAQIYNRICDGHGDNYDETTIKKVRNYIVNKNKTLYEKYDDAIAKGYTGEDFLDQIKDEDIFEQFDFLKAEVTPKVSDTAGDWGEPDSMLIDFSVEEIFEQFDFLKSTNNSVSTSDEWGEQIDFSVEEILDMPTMGEVQSHLAKKGAVTDSDLHGEVDKPKMDSEQGSQNSSKVDNLEMIDIDSLFDEDTDDRPVLSEEEAWELFA